MENEIKDPVISTGKAWLNLLLVFVAALLSVTVCYKVVPCMRAMSTDLGVGFAQLGLLMSAISFAGLVCSIPAGALLSKLGPKKAILVALGVLFVGNLIGCFTSNYVVLMISRIIEGCGFVFMGMVGPNLIAFLFPAEKRGLPNGVFATWNAIGIMIALQIATPTLGIWGWKGMWYISIILLIVAAVLVFAMRIPESAFAAGSEPGKKPPLSAGAKIPASWVLALIMFAFVIAMQVYSNYLPSYLGATFQMDTAAANNISSLFSMMMIIGPIVLGLVMSRVRNTGLIVCLICILSGACAVFEFLIPSAELALPLVCLFGLIYGCVPVAVFTAAPSLVPHPAQVGLIMGIAVFGQKLGGVIGPVIAGGIFDKTGVWSSVAGMMAVIAVLLVVCGIAYLVIQKKAAAKKAAQSDSV